MKRKSQFMNLIARCIAAFKQIRLRTWIIVAVLLILIVALAPYAIES
ncbi:hypothetical protein [Fructobacillus fructosus]|nr:hypothetical protein [Fructobacillus fructosus]MBC9119228.1 hypothetical protein [Fructobacillus fructosus]